MIKFDNGWRIKWKQFIPFWNGDHEVRYVIICPCGSTIKANFPQLRGVCFKHKDDSIPIEVITTFNLLQ